MIDVVQAITGKDARHAAEDVRGPRSSYPEVDGIPVHYRFAGRGKKDTRVVDAMVPRKQSKIVSSSDAEITSSR